MLFRWNSYEIPMNLLCKSDEIPMKFLWIPYENPMIWLYAAIWPRMARFCGWEPHEILMKFLPHIYGIPMKCVWDSYKVPMKILRNAYELKRFHCIFFEILTIWSYAAIWPRLARFCNADMRFDHAWNAIWPCLKCDLTMLEMRSDHAW